MTYQTDDRVRVRRQRTDRAIKLAMEGKWEEATQENQAILEVFPRDADAHNRLGKAYTEMGRYADARAAYGRSLEIDSNNAIARKNLQRLQALGETAAPPSEAREKVDPDLFIEETGKTGVTVLKRPDRDALQRMTAGDRVLLQRQGNGLIINMPTGEYLGLVEPRLALRLTRLMDSGNQYAAAIAAITDGRIIIKETYQSSDNVGRLSFPATSAEGVRPYTKDSLLRYDLEDDESEVDESEGNEDWDSEPEAETGPEVRWSVFEKTEADDDSSDTFEE